MAAQANRLHVPVTADARRSANARLIQEGYAEEAQAFEERNEALDDDDLDRNLIVWSAVAKTMLSREDALDGRRILRDVIEQNDLPEQVQADQRSLTDPPYSPLSYAVHCLPRRELGILCTYLSAKYRNNTSTRQSMEEGIVQAIHQWSSRTGTGAAALLARLDARSFVSLHDYALVLGESGMERLRKQCKLKTMPQGPVALFLTGPGPAWQQIRGISSALELLSEEQLCALSNEDRLYIGRACWSVVRLSTDLYYVDVKANGESIFTLDMPCAAGYIPYSAESAEHIWRHGEAVQIGCASLGCREACDMASPGRHAKESLLFAHIASYQHPTLIDGRHSKIELKATSNPSRWTVTCKEGCAFRGERFFQMDGTRQDAESQAMQHLREHVVARQEASYKNYASTVFSSWPVWFSWEMAASRNSEIKIYPEVGLLTAGVTLADLQIDGMHRRKWMEERHGWPSRIQLDYVVELQNTVHIIEEDPDQHRSYPRLPEWFRPAFIAAIVRKMQKEGEESPRFPGIIATLSTKPVYFHRVCLEGRLRIKDLDSNSSLIVPEELSGDLLRRSHNFWKRVDEIELDMTARLLEDAPLPSVSVGYPTLYHSYDLVVSLRNDPRPIVSQAASTAYPGILLDTIVGASAGVRGALFAPPVQGQGAEATLNILETREDLLTTQAAYLTMLQKDREWLASYSSCAAGRVQLVISQQAGDKCTLAFDQRNGGPHIIGRVY